MCVCGGEGVCMCVGRCFSLDGGGGGFIATESQSVTFIVIHTRLFTLAHAYTAHHENVANAVRFAGENVIIHDDKKPSRGSQTEAFVSELMHLLRCNNEALGVQIRETVKELISYELSPPVYPYLFQCMMSESSKVRGKGWRERESEGEREGGGREGVAYQS